MTREGQAAHTELLRHQQCVRDPAGFLRTAEPSPVSPVLKGCACQVSNKTSSRLNRAMRALTLVRERRLADAKRHLEESLTDCPAEAIADRHRLLGLSWMVNGLLGDWKRAFAELERGYRLDWPAERPLWAGEPLSTTP